MAVATAVLAAVIFAAGTLLVRAAARRALRSSPRYRAALGETLSRSAAGALARAWAREFRQDHPAAWNFLAARFDRSRFSGLPLTAVAVAGVGVALGLVSLVDELLEVEELARVDEALHGVLAPYRVFPLTLAFDGLTGFGDGSTLLAVAAVASALFWALGRSAALGPLWLSFLGAEATAWGGKYLFGRARPALHGLPLETPSFPSGHAAGAMVLYGFLAFAIARELRSAEARFEVGFWTTVLVSVVGASRVLLGVHYASDVVAGFLVGALWILAGVAWAGRRREIGAAREG